MMAEVHHRQERPPVLVDQFPVLKPLLRAFAYLEWNDFSLNDSSPSSRFIIT
jgi:hypothetical protein